MKLGELFHTIISTRMLPSERKGWDAWLDWRCRWIQPPLTISGDPWISPYRDPTGYWHSGGFQSDMKNRGCDIQKHIAALIECEKTLDPKTPAYWLLF